MMLLDSCFNGFSYIDELFPYRNKIKLTNRLFDCTIANGYLQACTATLILYIEVSILILNMCKIRRIDDNCA